MLNFGCIDGSRNLNRSRILKFEKTSEPDPDAKFWKQERSLKMWPRPPLAIVLQQFIKSFKQSSRIITTGNTWMCCKDEVAATSCTIFPRYLTPMPRSCRPAASVAPSAGIADCSR